MSTKRVEIRWSLYRAAQELGCHRQTLDKGLKAQGIEPGTDKKFSTRQIFNAMRGDIDAEKLELVREQKRKLQLENARTVGELIERDRVGDFLGKVFIGVRQKILSSALQPVETDELLTDLQRLKKSPFMAKFKEPVDL